MANVKEIVIYDTNPQTVRASRDMGMLLLHPDVRELVEGLGSQVRQDRMSSTIDIRPPLPSEQLHELAQALIAFALQLDPAPPEPTYKIVK